MCSLEFVEKHYHTNKLLMAAVSNNRMCNIQYIENQTEELCVASYNKDHDSFKYIKDPSYQLSLLAVSGKWRGENIKYVKNQHVDLCKIAIKNNFNNLKYITNPTEELRQFAYSVSKYAIEYIPDPPEEMQIDALLSSLQTRPRQFVWRRYGKMLIHSTGSQTQRKKMIDYANSLKS